MSKKVLFFFVLLSSALTLQASFEKTFKEYCQHRGDPVCSNPALDHTVDVLLEASETTDCDEAYARLSKVKFLNLANSGLTDLAPLAGLKELDHLDVSHNNLTHLWGLESLPQITIFSAHHNQLTNVTPLAAMKNLDTVNLENNNLEYLSPLKELAKLRIYKVDGNPVFDNDIEMMALNGQNGMRSKREFSLDGIIQYDFSPENTKEDFDERIEATARRKDFVFYRQLMTNPVIKARLLEEEFLMSTEVPVKKIILGVSEAENIAGSLACRFSAISDLEPLPKAKYVVQRRMQLQKFFEFYLAEGNFFPYVKKELDSLQKYLEKAIDKCVSGDPLHPSFIQNCCKAWEAQIKKTGIPPVMDVGFASM